MTVHQLARPLPARRKAGEEDFYYYFCLFLRLSFLSADP